MYKRKTGVLKPLSSKIPEYDLFAFDIETTGKDNKFLMGSIVGNRFNPVVFWDKQEMINCFLNNQCFYHNARVFATNLSFDLTALFQDSKELETMNILLRGSRIIQGLLPSASYHDIMFLDTMNFYPFSVKQQGQLIGLPKLETPAYIAEERTPMPEEYESIKEYNIRDSQITLGFSNFLQKSFIRMGCKMRITAASTALDMFKRKYLINPMWQEKKNIIEMQYKAYYGGRVEVFKRGLINNANYYDFNSLYPSVMCNEYPDVSSSTFKEKGKLDIIEDYHGISEVKVLCPGYIEIPLLPCRQDNKLLFPTGIFKGWYSHIELRKALALGYKIMNIGKQIYYTRTHFPFKQYVQDMYSIRKAKKEAGDASELVIKLLMNSLYGKFGQKITGKQQVMHLNTISQEEMIELDKKGNIMIAGDYLYYNEENPSYLASHIMPIYALYTTAYGRLKLYDMLQGIDPIYIDTDSIITNQELPTSAELGQLKKEYSIEEGIFIRPKMYAFKKKEGTFDPVKEKPYLIRIKGNHASCNWDYDRFKEFVSNPRIQTKVFSTFKTSNKKGIPYNSIIELNKEFGLQDDKREWQKEFDPMVMQASAPIRI